jgi:uncharacterized phiE125 gp8 family phage protein
MLETLIKAAIGMAEAMMNRQVLTAGITFTFDAYERYVRLPGGKVSTFTSLKYYDTDNAQQTLTLDTDFVVDKIKLPAVLFFLDGKLVDTYQRPDAFEAKYDAGWAVDEVPDDVLQAIKMTAAHYFENREAVLVGRRVEKIPFGAETVFKNHRIPNA